MHASSSLDTEQREVAAALDRSRESVNFILQNGGSGSVREGWESQLGKHTKPPVLFLPPVWKFPPMTQYSGMLPPPHPIFLL